MDEAPRGSNALGGERVPRVDWRLSDKTGHFQFWPLSLAFFGPGCSTTGVETIRFRFRFFGFRFWGSLFLCFGFGLWSFEFRFRISVFRVSVFRISVFRISVLGFGFRFFGFRFFRFWVFGFRIYLDAAPRGSKSFGRWRGQERCPAPRG
jgi:hypothetical protein